MMRKFINKILDVPKLIRTIWFILWILLIILLIMKFCFGIWYPIVIKNQTFLDVNDFIQNSWLKYFVLFIFYMLNANLLYLISSLKFKYTKWYEAIIINTLGIIGFLVKYFVGNIAIIFELIIAVIIPIIVLLKTYNKHNKIILILYPIVIQFLVFLWQLNIFLIRGVDFTKINDEYYLLGFVLQLDYYIFIIISWIGVTKMGLWGFWLFTKDVTALKAEREKELAKKNPNMDKVAKIDEHIKELEKEGK